MVTSVLVNLKNSRLLSSVTILIFGVAIAACGGSSPSGQAGASPASSAAPSATPSAKPSAGYAVNLTFTGTLAGTTTKAKAPSGTAACGDFVGHILVGVTLNGHDYDFLLTNVAYKALGKYTVGDASSETQVLFSDGGFGGKTIYSSTSGTVTYISAKSIVVDMDVAEQSTGQNAHISGTASCA
jgi:hypothetical protein